VLGVTTAEHTPLGIARHANGQPAVSPHAQPVPIASLAKVKTAYLVPEHYPPQASDSGRRLVVGHSDVADTETRRPRGSVDYRCPRR
jgi:hypothetical protein